MPNTNQGSHVIKLYQCLSQKAHWKGGKKKKKEKIVCLRGRGGSCEKCISCIAFLFLIFHALWIYLNPLRWIQKEKKGKAEVRDMQNKRHPPLANGLPLSSPGFLFLSSIFFSSLEGSFLKSFRDTKPKTMPITTWREGNRQVCDGVCVCVLWGRGGCTHLTETMSHP